MAGTGTPPTHAAIAGVAPGIGLRIGQGGPERARNEPWRAGQVLCAWGVVAGAGVCLAFCGYVGAGTWDGRWREQGRARCGLCYLRARRHNQLQMHMHAWVHEQGQRGTECGGRSAGCTLAALDLAGGPVDGVRGTRWLARVGRRRREKRTAQGDMAPAPRQAGRQSRRQCQAYALHNHGGESMAGTGALPAHAAIASVAPDVGLRIGQGGPERARNEPWRAGRGAQ